MTRFAQVSVVIGLAVGVGGAAAGEALPVTLPPRCNAHTPAQIAAVVNHQLSCGFDRTTMSYAGSPVEQARCLMRIIPNGGHLTEPQALPPTLERRVGLPTDINRDAFKRYLAVKTIKAAEVGGDLSAPLAHTSEGRPTAYFVIHDTSTPNYQQKPFPSMIDHPSWPFNNLMRWDMGSSSIAHVFVARTGLSLTALDYSTPWRATKTETCVLGERGRGLFVHTEMVQPRRSDPHRPKGNDALAPDGVLKAFGDAQLDRLALLYIAASVRAGHWLIPASHAAIDDGLNDGHDDPRAFPIADWAARVDKTAADIRAQ